MFPVHKSDASPSVRIEDPIDEKFEKKVPFFIFASFTEYMLMHF